MRISRWYVQDEKNQNVRKKQEKGLQKFSSLFKNDSFTICFYLKISRGIQIRALEQPSSILRVIFPTFHPKVRFLIILRI